jgi:hypothetical protein
MGQQKTYNNRNHPDECHEQEEYQHKGYHKPGDAGAGNTYIGDTKKQSAVLPEYQKYVVEIGPYRLLKPHEPILLALDVISLILAVLISIYLYSIVHCAGVFLGPFLVFACAWLGLELFCVPAPGFGFVMFIVYLCDLVCVWFFHNLGLVV